MTRVYIEPFYEGEDLKGDGGIRRVVEAQRRWLAEYDIQVVSELEQADVVNVHIAPMIPTLRYLKAHPQLPLVVSNHGLYWSEYDWSGWALKANADCTEAIRIATVVTTPSEWVARAVRRHSMRDVHPIGHGVELSEWATATDAGPLTIVRETKEPLTLQPGYVLWNKSRPDEVCSPAPIMELAKLMPEQEFISTFGEVAANLTITGRLSYEQSKQVLRSASVYLATTRETFGIGTLEAMAAGVPVVGWAWGGQPDIITQGETGWLARPGDFLGLIDGVHWAQANRTKVVRRARALVRKRYQWKDVIKSYADLYKELVERAAVARPKTSIIVTAYNLAEYLPACLDSVLAQTLQSWECIIVDDASPDQCGAIAEEYAAKDTRFKVVHNSVNQYLAGARNTGIAASSGEYILPLDADDMLTPTAIEVLAGELDKNRAIHIAYGGVEFLEPDGRRWHSGWPMPFRLDWQLKGEGQLLPYSSMFRREVWELTGGYRTRTRSSEDCDLWLRCCSYGFRPEMVTTADTLIYRNRADSMSRTQGWQEHRAWYPWTKDINLAPAAAVSVEQLPVSSLQPPQVAVIIPVGPGHEQIVIDAVDSVDAQTHRTWECIVVNDSGVELRGLPSWVQVVQGGEKRLGVAAARNLGVKASSAPLFVPLDADDYLQPNALAVMLEIHRQIGGYVYSDWWETWNDGRIQVYEAPDYDAHLLTTKGCLHAITALYPKAAWEKVGGFDPDLYAWEDWGFQLALADIGVCGSRVPAPLFVYRKDAGKRRDENYANFEEAKASILSKWGALWEGGKELMGCRSCGGGGGKTVRPLPAAVSGNGQPSNIPPGDDVVIIEYRGNILGGRLFRGPATSTSYRFDGGSGRIKYVYRADASLFEGRPDFYIFEVPKPGEIAGTAGPELIATGPPV